MFLLLNDFMSIQQWIYLSIDSKPSSCFAASFVSLFIKWPTQVINYLYLLWKHSFPLSRRWYQAWFKYSNRNKQITSLATGYLHYIGFSTPAFFLPIIVLEHRGIDNSIQQRKLLLNIWSVWRCLVWVQSCSRYISQYWLVPTTNYYCHWRQQK